MRRLMDAACVVISAFLNVVLWACPSGAQVTPLPANSFMASPSGGAGNLSPRTIVSSDLFQASSCSSGLFFYNNAGVINCTAAGTGTVTSTSWTGGIVSIATPTTTPAFTIAGTPGGIVYFPTASTWASTASGTATQLLHGGGGTPSFSAIVSADVSTVLASPPPIGSTVANTGAFSTLSATGLSTLSGALTLSGSTGTQPTLLATNTGTATLYGTPAFDFLESEGYASFGSTNTHFGFVVQATKNVAGSTTTGSRQAFTAQQLGVGGTANDFFTGGFELVEPCTAPITCNAFNLGGNFTANNPYAYIPTGMATQSVVGEEIDDTVVAGSTVAYREGLRIVDIGSGVNGSALDAAINVANSGVGWKSLLWAGDNTATFALTAGGTFIGTPATTVALASLMDFSPITGIPTKGGIVLGPNAGQNICWGLTSACLGGQVTSQTAAGGGQIVFINGYVGIGSGTIYFYVTNAGQLLHTPKTFAALPACNAGTKGEQDEISDQAVALGFNSVANGGGAISAAVRCDGASWKDF